MAKRYKEFWVCNEEKEPIVFFSQYDIEQYVRTFPPNYKILMTQHPLDCCDKGHTFKEIMGFDEWKHN